MNTETIDESPSLSVVVPCYNEEEVINELYRRVSSICHDVAGTSRYELILINDGSKDSTWPLIQKLIRHDQHVVGVNLSRNFGHQLALTAGLELARGERILVLDADLQDPPELLPDMMKLMDEGADVVYGQRRNREGESLFKLASAEFFYRLLARVTEIDIPLNTGDFRLMSSRVNKALSDMPEKQRFIRGMVAWLGFKQVPLLYDRKERFAGQTKYPLSKMLKFALDAITSFSISPIRISAWFAILFALMSMVFFGYVLISWFMFSTAPGWTSLGALVTLFGAAQFLVLGIIGEYIGRIYIESKNRPLYLIERVVTQNSLNTEGKSIE